MGDGGKWIYIYTRWWHCGQAGNSWGRAAVEGV